MVKYLLIASLLIIVFFLIAQCSFQRIIFPAPDSEVPSPPPMPMQEVFLNISEEYKIHGWYYESIQKDATVILYFHGNGENLGTMNSSGLFISLQKLNYTYLAVDYPGYGLSTGKPSEKTLISAGQTALKWLNERFPNSRIVIIGWSLGASAAILTTSSADIDINGLVVLSGWTSLVDVASKKVSFFSLFIRDHFNSLEAIKNINCPILIIHGKEDTLIPYTHSEELALQAPLLYKSIIIPNIGHNNLYRWSEIWPVITEFINQL